MAQYKTGTVNVTNGSDAVVGVGTLWLTNISIGDWFVRKGDDVSYQVKTVATDTSLTLVTNYGGTTATGVSYSVTTDFTANFNIPLLARGDIDTATIFARAMAEIDNLLGLNTGEWIDLSDTPTFVDADTFTLVGDKTADYQVDRRIRMTDATVLYGTITASSFAAGITTIDALLDSGSLSASLSAVAVGIASVTNPAISGSAIRGGTPKIDAIDEYTAGAGVTIDAVLLKDGLVDGRNVATDGTKLDGISAGAEVNPDLISQAEAEAGTATTERIFSALRVAQAIAALETGGGDPHPVDDTTTLVRDPADNTRLMRIDVGAVAAATTRVLSMPDQDINLTPGTGSFATEAEGNLATTALQNLVEDTTPQFGGAVDGQDNTLSRVNLKDYGEITNAIGGTGGGTQDIDLELGNVITATVDTSANTFTFSNPTASDEGSSFTLILTNGGSQTVTWPASVTWITNRGSAPTLQTSGVDILTFFTVDGGTIWYGFANVQAILDSDISEAEGYVRKTAAGAYEAIKTNLTATVAPTVNEDSGDGYAVGSRWIDVTADKEYVALDVTVAAAVWTETTGGGFVKQVISTQDGEVATGTTLMFGDNTIPLITEGDEYMTLAITPGNTNNRLLIEVTVNFGSSASDDTRFIVALFQDTTANAVAGVVHNLRTNDEMVITFQHVMTAGTTSATTFRIRAGSELVGTTTFNGSATFRRLGGVNASSIVITEI